ncbi:MAG: FAD/NAD(P)-binding oxidoreductase [Saprospiraceae bacterium]|nr:FAD/NAD(P)-binding oxidoreductase [Saprospiraceae bacterium]
MKKHQIVVVGAGSAGLAVAAMLMNKRKGLDICIIDKAEKHYYQPLWTLVGAGVFPKEETERDMADYIPFGTTWIKDFVASFDPDNNKLKTQGGEEIGYDYLVVAAGIQINWDEIPGLKEAVGRPETGVVSNYSYETAESTWEAIRNLKSGTAIFTHNTGPVKCGGAPMKICFLASDYWRKHGYLKNVNVELHKGGGIIFGVPKFAKTLDQVVDRYGINTVFNSDLIAIDGDNKKATFRDVKTGEETVKSYDMIHVTPKQGAPDFIKNSPLAAENGGWVDVDKYTTQHNKYPNVFSLGDNSSLPAAKTGAAIRKQAPVTVNNLLAHMEGRELTEQYDGYSSCPLVTGYGKLVLAEFDYNNEPKESFPFDQAQERFSMYALKAYALPKMYWHGMLRGREF